MVRRPFLVSAELSPYSISQSRFRRLRRAKKLELMLEWFAQNFESPNESLPYESAEGGFQWIWGGPYQARDELDAKFGGLVSEALVEEATAILEQDGVTDWSPIPKTDDYDTPDHASGALPSLDDIPDEPGPFYGSPEDYSARETAIKALTDLEAAIPPERHVGIGHNRPPDDIDDDEFPDLRPSIQVIQKELAKPQPSISFIKRLAVPLEMAAKKVARYIGQKLDTVLDEAAKTAGKLLGGAIVAGAGALFHQAIADGFSKLMTWLQIVTTHF